MSQVEKGQVENPELRLGSKGSNQFKSYLLLELEEHQQVLTPYLVCDDFDWLDSYFCWISSHLVG